MLLIRDEIGVGPEPWLSDNINTPDLRRDRPESFIFGSFPDRLYGHCPDFGHTADHATALSSSLHAGSGLLPDGRTTEEDQDDV